MNALAWPTNAKADQGCSNFIGTFGIAPAGSVLTNQPRGLERLEPTAIVTLERQDGTIANGAACAAKSTPSNYEARILVLRPSRVVLASFTRSECARHAVGRASIIRELVWGFPAASE